MSGYGMAGTGVSAEAQGLGFRVSGIGIGFMVWG